MNTTTTYQNCNFQVIEKSWGSIGMLFSEIKDNDNILGIKT
jgi:hypothetical protein